MNAKLVLAVGIICVSITCFAIPAIIQNNQIILSPEQKADYYTKVSKRPDEYTYNPMHLNDTWWYSATDFSGHPPTIWTSYITEESLINGILHYQAHRPGTDDVHWIKNDNDLVWMYDTDDIDNNAATQYVLQENFTTENGIPDTLYWAISSGWCELTQCITYGTGFVQCFGDTVEYRYNRYALVNSPVQYTIWWARKYGIIATEGDFFHMSIIGTLINGEMYGSTSAVNDENIPAAGLLSVTNYPNPFGTYTTIKYQAYGAKTDPVTINIYNIKCQLVKSYITPNIGEFIWDGTDDADRSISTGIYFYQIKSKYASSRPIKFIHLN